MKRLITVLLTALLFISATDPASLKKEYVKKWAPTAQKEMRRTGVPASITLAQGILESRYGQSPMAKDFNNHFGIKCHKGWKGPKAYFDDDAPRECFRAYKNAEESFRDHSDFLRYQDRYKALFELKATDYKGWARGLKTAGYATDPAYASKLIDIIEELGLARYDKGQAVPEKTPLAVESPLTIDAGNYSEEYSFSVSRPVYKMNGVPFVYSMEGETYESIATHNDLFLGEILRYNDLKSDARLDQGTIVYLKPKKKQAAAGIEMIIIGPGDNLTMHDISQRFGIKESSLCKMNKLPAYYRPEEGETIILRKR